MKTFLLPVWILFFVCCCDRYDKHTPTMFFKIEDEWSSISKQNKHEVFVIYNPPNDTLMLKNVIDTYNLQTVSIDSLKNFSLTRTFYRETGCLTRNYEQGKPYPTRSWRNIPCNIFYNGDDPGQQTRYHYYGEGYLMETYHAIYPNTPDVLNYEYTFGMNVIGNTTDVRVFKIYLERDY